jgi:hypothetical protein
MGLLESRTDWASNESRIERIARLGCRVINGTPVMLALLFIARWQGITVSRE